MATNTSHQFFHRVFLFSCLLIFTLTSQAMADSSRAVKKGDEVSIHYTGSTGGEVFDSSKGRDPLKFVVGTEQIITGLSNGMIGMKAGETREIDIEPEDAYGNRDDALVFKVLLKELPEGISKGAMLVGPQGRRLLVTDVTGNKATLDANHPLAGKKLKFEVELISLK